MISSIRIPWMVSPKSSRMSSYQSFRHRLLHRLLPVLVLVLAVEAVASVYFIREYAYDELNQRMDLIGQNAKRNHMLASAVKYHRIYMIEGVGDSILSMPEVLYFAVRGLDGAMLYEDEKQDLVHEERIIREYPVVLFSAGITDPEDEMFQQQTRTQFATMVIGFNTRFADERFQSELINRGLIALVFLVIIVMGVDYAFRTSIGKPLVHLAGAMRRTRDAQPDIDSRDEIGLLVNEYNQMVNQQTYLLNAAQMMSNSGSWVLDAETDEMVWSEQLYKLFGVNPGDFQPDMEKTLSFIHPDDLQIVEKAINTTLQFCRDFNHEIRIIRADGQERIVYFQTHCFVGEWKRIIRMIGNLTDITQRKKDDTERQQAMKLHALGGLASGMAHSLNNLILPILMSSHLMQKSMSGDRDNSERLQRVIQAAERARELIAKVLEFSHQEETRFSSINLTNVLRNAMRLVQVSAPSAIRIETSIPEKSVRIRGDKTQLETVILDLVANALGAMEGINGRLRISLTIKSIEQELTGFPANVPAGEYACLTVEDTGTGISPTIIKNVFDPFFTTKTSGKGTGMGLSNVEGTVSAHEGFVQLESEPGAGSCFRLYFPLDTESL